MLGISVDKKNKNKKKNLLKNVFVAEVKIISMCGVVFIILGALRATMILLFSFEDNEGLFWVIKHTRPKVIRYLSKLLIGCKNSSVKEITG